MSVLGDILGWLLIIGGFISYYFQIYKLYIRKNTQGLNLNMIIFGALGSYFNLLGIIGLNIKHLLHTCQGYQCVSDCLPIIQMFSPWICYEIIYLLYYKYTENISKFVFIGIHINYVIFISLTMILSLNNNQLLTQLSIFYNVLASILSIIMWIPQIITTIKDKQEGTLSLWSIGTHAIGCIMVIIYQCGFEKQNFTNVISYLFSLIFEIFIVMYCLYYKKYTDNRNERIHSNSSNPESNLSTIYSNLDLLTEDSDE
jgi:uncharacterized protein with PQ loop repeat